MFALYNPCELSLYVSNQLSGLLVSPKLQHPVPFPHPPSQTKKARASQNVYSNHMSIVQHETFNAIPEYLAEILGQQITCVQKKIHLPYQTVKISQLMKR